jgi:hypothetical protein
MMDINWKNIFVVGGLAVALTFGGLTGCGDGIDPDNGVSDGQQKDEIDNDTQMKAKKDAEEAEKKAQETAKKAEEKLKEAQKEVENKLENHSIGDGVDQDNDPSDGKQKDEVDDKNKNPETN